MNNDYVLRLMIVVVIISVGLSACRSEEEILDVDALQLIDGETAYDVAVEPTVGITGTHPDWITKIPNVERAKLSALTLPGTHDSGTYALKDVIAPSGDGKFIKDGICDYTIEVIPGVSLSNSIGRAAAKRVSHKFGKTQNQNIYNQLEQGIRFIDLRVVYSVDGFYIQHGLLGPRMEDVFSQISDFMKTSAGEKEVVLLSMTTWGESVRSSQMSLNSNLSCGDMFEDMSPERKMELQMLAEKYLGVYLYWKPSYEIMLHDIRIGEIVKNGPKVIMQLGGEINGKWSNKDTRANLTASQQTLINGHYEKEISKLLELQWVLTAQQNVVEEATKCELYNLYCDANPISIYYAVSSCPFSPSYSSVHQLSGRVNPYLRQFVEDQGQGKLNIVRIDFFEETDVVDLAIDHPVAVCEDVIVSADEQCMGNAFVDGGSSDFGEGFITLSQEPQGPYPLGDTEVILSVSDESLHSSCNATVSVVDSDGPTIDTLVVIPDSTWPPNHKMVPVVIEVSASDNCASDPVCKIIMVQSDEDSSSEKGTGNTEIDWVITGDMSVELRAERAGMKDGRSYEVTAECIDDFGNATTASAFVEVPKSSSK